MSSNKKEKERTTAVIPGRDEKVKVFCAFQKLVDPVDLHVHPDNNNDHTAEQIEMMCKMIRANGWRSVITVSEKSQKIVAGHLRVRAALVLGMAQVPVDYQYFANRAAEVKHLTADNELAKLSEFNAERFSLTAKELEQEMAPEDFEAFMFDSSEFGLEDIPGYLDEGDGGTGKVGKNKEINTENFGDDLRHKCPKCSFEFNE
jgi:hypothetical protein